MVLRVIESFFQDEEQHWAANLSCGHTQHLRHLPPLASREWVQTEEGRQEKVGTQLDCNFCDMPALPSRAEVYKRTRSFTESTVPQGLTECHSTKAGTWGRIVIEEGKLLYQILHTDQDCPDASVVSAASQSPQAPVTTDHDSAAITGAPAARPGPAGELRDSWVLRPGVSGHIAPEQPHQVKPVGSVRFHVEFLKVEES